MPSSHQLPFDFSLQHESTFENYVCPETNRELLENLKKSAEPHPYIFIWGSEGSGRSHLLQACYQQSENSVYVPLQRYAENGPDILNGLEQLDLVCLDDLDHVLADRNWEEQIFELFNDVNENKKRLIVAASVPPQNLACALADLESRLSWGVIYQVHALDDEGKLQALQLRAKRNGIPLNNEVLNYILMRSSRSMNNLFAVLTELDQLSLAEKRKITIPFVKEIMKW